MPTERARFLIRAAIDSIDLPRVGVPPTTISPAPPARRANATRCNAVQPDGTPRNGAARTPNEPTAALPSETRAAARGQPAGPLVPASAGARRGTPQPQQPGATPRHAVKPGATRRPSFAPNEPTAAGGSHRETPDAALPSSLTPRQLAAVRAMLAGTKPAEVAQRLGISRQTIWRWSQQPEFATELRRL